ncbi:MAG: NAD-dependent epimerase/dehydratase family protein [Polyangiaceae bacterium]
MARIAVTGPTGGLGSNVVAAATAAGHDVVVLVRDRARAPRTAATVTVFAGDATSSRDVERVARNADVLVHCANPPFDDHWAAEQAKMADAALDAAAKTGARLVFPANVWVYGPRAPGERVPDDAPLSPASRKGEVRASIESRIRTSGVPFTIARLAEFYGPGVTTLTARSLGALARGGVAHWYGPPDVAIELAYMPDAGRGVLAAALSPDCVGRSIHVPTIGETTPRAFLELARARAGEGSVRFMPAAAVRAAGLVSETARAFADILHLWTHPVLLRCDAWRALGLPLPSTEYQDGIDATLSWLREAGPRD